MLRTLRRGAGKQRLDHDRIAAPQLGVIGHIAHSGERTDSRAAVADLDEVERKPVNIDQMFRSLDPVLHQLDQICAARR